jgi:hypothetical protein
MKRFANVLVAAIGMYGAAVSINGQTTPQSSAPQTPAAGTAAPAQNPPAGEQTTAPANPPASKKEERTQAPRHLSVGLRARVFPDRSLSVMGSQTLLTTTTVPPVNRDWNFTTTSHSSIWGIGPAVEYAVSPKLTFTLEVIYQKLNYTKETSIAWGTDDPTTTTDERTHMFRNETTKANLFDVPLMVHYKGLRSTGPFSKVFVAAGVTGRTVSSIKTTLLTTFPDTSTATTNPATRPSRRTLLGGVAGIGYRVTDDFNINWTPEVRYTRWAGSTFGSDSTVSPRNQLEVGLGITF